MAMLQRFIIRSKSDVEIRLIHFIVNVYVRCT